MTHHLILIIVLVGVLGIGAQWLAWLLRIPAILLLIIFGLIAGPLLGWIRPAEDLGDLLQPVIALGVAVILFEGGLNLQWHEYKETGVTVNRLILAGVPLSWGITSLAGHYVGNLSWPVAILFGAILVVTGPTVIMPLLREARLQRRPASLLKWEGIITDPLGALLAVLTFEYVSSAYRNLAVPQLFGSLALALFASVGFGAAVAFALGYAFKREIIPEFLKSPVLLVTVLAVYLLANRVQAEAGLLAVTTLGVVLANRGLPSIVELKRFKEYMAILMVSGVFILLTADIDIGILQRLDWHSAALLLCVLFVIRPLAVYLATTGSGMPTAERVLIAWIAPRGIVAAAMAGLFAPRLIQGGHSGAELLVPMVFALIVLTVAAHSLTISWIARRLGLAAENPNGVLVVGASPWSVALAKTLHELDFPVLLSDSSWHRLAQARLGGLRVHHGQLLSEIAEASLDLHDINQLLAVTPNDAYNALVCTQFAPEFGRNQVHQLAGESRTAQNSKELAPMVRGNLLFDQQPEYEDLMRCHYKDWQFHKTPLTDEYTYDDYLRDKPGGALTVALVRKRTVQFYPLGQSTTPAPGDIVITFAPADYKQASNQAGADEPLACD
jgi:NhaP-type Na+/H+ or K+/H+ antiporter